MSRPPAWGSPSSRPPRKRMAAPSRFKVRPARAACFRCGSPSHRQACERLTMQNKPRVLIIDDEPSIVRVIEDELTFEGFEARSASEGAAGVELAAAWVP